MYDDDILGPRFIVQNRAFDTYMMDSLKRACEMSVPVYKVNTSDFDYFKQPWITYDNYIKPNCIVKIEKETKKMEAKKCDRCGKLYETESANYSIDVLFKQEKISDSDRERYSEFYNNETRTHGVKISKWDSGDKVDFCPECRESFKKWFEES